MRRYRPIIGLLLVAVFTLAPSAQALAAGTARVNIAGTGTGTVSSVEGFGTFNPAFAGIMEGEPPIECSYTSPGPATGVCEDEMEFSEAFGFEGTFVTATAAPGSEVIGWTRDEGPEMGFCPKDKKEAEEKGEGEPRWCLLGELSGGSAEATVVIDKIGGSTFPLEVSLAGTGEGEVTSSPVGIECGIECEAEFEEGEEVELTATPETGSEFTGWSGDCTGTGACEVTMTEAKEVTATFEPEQVALTVEVEGPGSVSAPEDIDCPGVCGGNYSFGEEVEVTATPDEGALFVEWTGSGAGSCAGSSTPVCEVEMDEDKTVKAIFEAEPAPESFTLTVAKAGTGQGTVTSSPAGIECGSTCSTEFEEETEVALKATPASGSTFAGWSGACSGIGSCEVTMSEARSVTATFSANPPEKTCATDPSLCPAPPPGEGIAKVASSAKVKSGKAQLKLTCAGEGACKGTLKLTAKIKSGGKTKNLTVGKGSFGLAKGAKATLKVKLSGPARQALAKGPLKAKVKGTGVASSTVKLKA